MTALADPPATTSEIVETFPCFGSQCTVIVAPASGGSADEARMALARARRQLLDWHAQFSRFLPDSELTRLNRDARATVPVSPMLRRIVAAAVAGAERTGGLVDPTLGAAIEAAGYAGHFDGPGLDAAALAAPSRAAAGPDPATRWRAINVDRRAGTVTRPPGLRLDPGGIAKGVFADELGALLGSHGAYVVECAGDMRLGGRAGVRRRIDVAGPFGGRPLHAYELSAGGIATSGIGRRSWLGPDGTPAHHLLDPRTGRPAFTGIVQVTALARTATEAEVRSKAALLSGPAGAERWLPDGGVIVRDDGSVHVV